MSRTKRTIQVAISAAAVASIGLVAYGCSAPGDKNPAPVKSAAATSQRAQNVLNPEVQTGLFGIYSGELIDADSFAGEVNGSQSYTVDIQPSKPTIDHPRQVASLHLLSTGDQFENVDFMSPLEIYLNGAMLDDGSVRYEFFTDAAVIPNLTSTRVKIMVVLTLLPGPGLKVDSSQSSIRILDCGFSGDAGCSELYQFAQFSGFGKR